MLKLKDNKGILLYKSGIFPKRLREAREYRGFAQKIIAEILNIQVASYGKYELGERELNASLLPLIANFEEIDINFFFDETMSIKDADLKLRQSNKAFIDLAKEVQEIKQQIAAQGISEKEEIKEVLSLLKIANKEDMTFILQMIRVYIESKYPAGQQQSQKKRDPA